MSVSFYYCKSWGFTYISNRFFFFGGVFLGLHSQHVEVPRAGVESELSLPAYATAIRELRCVCH